LIGLFLALSAALALGAQEVPRNEGWVTDNAGLLTPAQEAELEDLLGRYQQGTGHETALLTVKSLEGRPIEELALNTAREWGVSGRNLNDGLLLVVAKDDRQMRFEVGQGLEGGLTDAIAGRIIRDVMAPAFRDGRFYEGIRAGLVSAHEAIGGEYGSLERGGRPAAEVSALCPLLLLLLFIALAVASRRGKRAGARRGCLQPLLLPTMFPGPGRSRGWHGGFPGGGGFSRGGGGGFRGFSGFGGGRGFGGGGASGGW